MTLLRKLTPAIIIVATAIISYIIANTVTSESIKVHNRTFITCMEDMQAGGEEIRFAIDACTIQLHYGGQ